MNEAWEGSPSAHLGTTITGFNERLQEQLAGTVWNTGCASWYMDDTGRNVTQWPDWTWRFRRRTARFDPAAYQLDPGPADVEKAAA